MEVIINHYSNRIKNGWAVRAPQLGLAAHGHSEETARLNLERGVRLFFAPFERNGTLGVELNRIGLEMTANGDGLTILLR